MKLLELFDRLDEDKQVYFAQAKEPSNALMLYGNRRQPPNTALVPMDGQPLGRSQNVLVIRAKTRTGNQHNRELIRRREQDPEWQEAWYGWGRGYLNPQAYEKYPQVWRQKPITDPAALFRFMTTDVGIGRDTYEQLIGPAPEDLGEEVVNFHGARLFLPTTASKRSLAAATKTLEHVFQSLNAKGLGDVMKGDIRFMRLKTGVGGTYNMGSGDMQVNPSIKDTAQTVYSLLHEYGHKYMEEGGRRDEIVAKYEDLQMEGEGHMPNMDTASAMQDAISKVQPGLPVYYKGRKRGMTDDRNYVVKSVGGGKAYLAHAANPERVVFSIPPEGLVQQPKKFQLPDDIGLPLETEKWNDKSDQWFVSPYSETNEQEWWAELFAYYTMGNLHGEPAQWIQQFLGGRATETVGSNAGEVNSDSEMPPVAHGDEEGNASWDWTDPYHSSGSTNAVMSSTP